jgi:predicted negative regulator of RcsB-dependent stress response
VADHLQEEEQLDAIKQWWDENRVSVIAAVVLTIGGSFGWSQYQDHTVSTADAAANAYDEVLQLKLSGESAEQLATLSRGLRERHAGDAFADFASLQVASAAVEAGDLALAERELESVMASVDLETTVGQLAQLRLARVLAANGNEARAIAILELGSDSFPGQLCTSARGCSPCGRSTGTGAGGLSHSANSVAITGWSIGPR